MSKRGRKLKGRTTDKNVFPESEDKVTSDSEESDDASSKMANPTVANKPCATSPDAQAEPSLANIFAAIQKVEGDIKVRFNALDAKLHAVQTSLNDHTTRIDDLEESGNDYETRIAALEKLCDELVKTNKAMKTKLIDLEGRSRRCNIKITGLPEKVEDGKPTEFVAGFLPKLLGLQNFPGGLKVERAHRLGQPVSTRPRTMIAKIHHFQEKEKILKLARQQSPLSSNGARINVYPDFSPEVNEQRRAFDGAREKLRRAGIKHGILFPARLILTHGNEQKIFQKPADAEAFINSIAPNNAATGPA